MKELIEFIVKALVDDPSEVNTEITGDKITLYELRFRKPTLKGYWQRQNRKLSEQLLMPLVQNREVCRARNYRVNESSFLTGIGKP